MAQITALPPPPGKLTSSVYIIQTMLPCVAAGLLIGALTSFGQTYLPVALAALANSVSAWLVAPFGAGARTRSRRLALLTGTTVCVTQLIGYDVTSTLRGFATGIAINAFWGLCAVVGGPVCGWAGWAWRRGSGSRRALAAAVLPGAFLAEGLWVYALTLRAGTTAALWFAVGVLLAVAFAHRRLSELRWVALTFAAASLAELLLTALYTQAA